MAGSETNPSSCKMFHSQYRFCYIFSFCLSSSLFLADYAFFFFLVQSNKKVTGYKKQHTGKWSKIKSGVSGIIQTEKQNNRDIIYKLWQLVLKYDTHRHTQISVGCLLWLILTEVIIINPMASLIYKQHTWYLTILQNKVLCNKTA